MSHERKVEPTNNSQYIALEKKILKVKDEIKVQQAKAKGILKAGNEYKENNPAQCRYAFIQF